MARITRDPYYIKSAPEAAANSLVKEAYKKWKLEEEVIDDITCVIVYFDEGLIQASLKAAIKDKTIDVSHTLPPQSY